MSSSTSIIRVAPTMLAVCIALSACTSPRAVLVNDKGEYTSCAANGAGLIGSAVASGTFNSCVAEAKKKGYRIESQQ